jgi:hypothetical protein
MKELAINYKNIVIVTHHDNIVAYTKKPTKNCQVLKVEAENL